MNGTKWKLLFFAPVLRISRTADRTKANIHERKRIAIAHAKFVLAENTHYLRTFRIMALVTRLLRVTIELMTAWIFIRVITHIMASFWRAIIAPIMTWLLCRVTRAITQVILHDVVVALATLTLRRVISRMVACFFVVRHMRFKPGAFMARYSRYKAGSFDPLL